MLNIVTKKINDLPVTIIDNFYSDKECQLIFDELRFLNNDLNKLKSPSHPNGPGTSYVNGIPLKHNTGLFLDACYPDRSISNILTVNRKIFSKEIKEILVNEHVFFSYITLSNQDTTKLHYFDDGDYYDLHNDSAIITVISWFYEEPKSFSGGNLIFENDLNIETLNNRVVFFPSCLYHRVDPVKIFDNKDQKYGRYSISQFLCLGI